MNVMRRNEVEALDKAGPIKKNMHGGIEVFIGTITFLLLLFAPLYSCAQEKFTLKGYVKDSLSGETLIGASIVIKDETRGVSTNQYGFFSLTLQK